jgi:hypothetical protein
MTALGKLLAREVILTMENWKVAVFLRYRPDLDTLTYEPITFEPGPSMSREEVLRWFAKEWGMEDYDE